MDTRRNANIVHGEELTKKKPTTEDILLSDHPARRRNVEFTEVHWNPDKNPVGKTSNAMSRQPVNIKRNFFFFPVLPPLPPSPEWLYR